MFTNHSMALCHILLRVTLCYVLLSMQVIQCQPDSLENDACARQDLMPLCACIHNKFYQALPENYIKSNRHIKGNNTYLLHLLSMLLLTMPTCLWLA